MEMVHPTVFMVALPGAARSRINLNPWNSSKA
jgi:hypothetical protein